MPGAAGGCERPGQGGTLSLSRPSACSRIRASLSGPAAFPLRLCTEAAGGRPCGGEAGTSPPHGRPPHARVTPPHPRTPGPPVRVWGEAGTLPPHARAAPSSRPGPWRPWALAVVRRHRGDAGLRVGCALRSARSESDVGPGVGPGVRGRVLRSRGTRLSQRCGLETPRTVPARIGARAGTVIRVAVDLSATRTSAAPGVDPKHSLRPGCARVVCEVRRCLGLLARCRRSAAAANRAETRPAGAAGRT